MGARELACLVTWLILTALSPTAAEKSKFYSDHYISSCSECKYLFDQLHSLLTTLEIQQENIFRGVCDKCTMKNIKTQCEKCSKLINTFLCNTAHDNEEKQLNVKKWLTRIKLLLSNIIDKDDAMLQDELSRTSFHDSKMPKPRASLTEHLIHGHIPRNLGPDYIPEKPAPSKSLQKLRKDVTGEFQKLLKIIKEPLAMRQLEAYDFLETGFDPRNSSEIIDDVLAKLTEARTSRPGHEALAKFEEAKKLIPGYAALTKLEELGKVLLILPLHDCLVKINEVKILLKFAPDCEILTKLDAIATLLSHGAGLGALEQLEEAKNMLQKFSGQRAISAMEIFKKEIPPHEEVSKLTEFKNNYLKYFPAGHEALSKLEEALNSPIGPELLYHLKELKKMLPFGHAAVPRLEKIIQALPGHDKLSKFLEDKKLNQIGAELRGLQETIKGSTSDATFVKLQEALALPPGPDLLVKLEELKRNLPVGHAAIARVEHTMRQIPGYEEYSKDIEKFENFNKDVAKLKQFIKTLPGDHKAKILFEQVMKSFPGPESLEYFDKIKKMLPPDHPGSVKAKQIVKQFENLEKSPVFQRAQKATLVNNDFKKLVDVVKALPGGSEIRKLLMQANTDTPESELLALLKRVGNIIPDGHPAKTKLTVLKKALQKTTLSAESPDILKTSRYESLETLHLKSMFKTKKKPTEQRLSDSLSDFLIVPPIKRELATTKAKAVGFGKMVETPSAEITKSPKKTKHDDMDLEPPPLQRTGSVERKIYKKRRDEAKIKNIIKESDKKDRETVKDYLKTASSLTLQTDAKIVEKFKEIEKIKKVQTISGQNRLQKLVSGRATKSDGEINKIMSEKMLAKEYSQKIEDKLYQKEKQKKAKNKIGGKLRDKFTSEEKIRLMQLKLKTAPRPKLTPSETTIAKILPDMIKDEKQDTEELQNESKDEAKDKYRKKNTEKGKVKKKVEEKEDIIKLSVSEKKPRQMKLIAASEGTLAKLKPSEVTLDKFLQDKKKYEEEATAELESKDEIEDTDGKTTQKSKKKEKKKIGEKEDIKISDSEEKLRQMKLKAVSESTLAKLKPSQATLARLMQDPTKDEKKVFEDLKAKSKEVLSEDEKNKDIKTAIKSKFKPKQKTKKKGKSKETSEKDIRSAEESDSSIDKVKDIKQHKKSLKSSKSQKMLMKADKMLMKLLKQRKKQKEAGMRKRMQPVIKIQPLKPLPVVKKSIKVYVPETPSSVIECEEAASYINLMVKGLKIISSKLDHDTSSERIPMYFKKTLELSPLPEPEKVKDEVKDEPPLPIIKKPSKNVAADAPVTDASGVFRYALSNPKFIDKGITLLPTIKVMKRVNIYKMLPVHPESNWFRKNKCRGILYYDSGEKLAEVDHDGHGRWYYKNGVVALSFYKAEDYMDSLCKDHFLQRQYRKLDGGVLWSRNERNLDCTVTFQTHSILQRFMLHFDLLQLDCNDHLYVYDGAHATAPPKADLSCRNTKQQVGALFTRSNFVTLKYVTDNWGTDANGFKLVITAVKDPKHGCKEFRCKQREFCVSADLTCDGVDHCADGSDEDTVALCPETGGVVGSSTWLAAAAGGSALAVLLTALALCCACRRRASTRRTHLNLQQMSIGNGAGKPAASPTGSETRLPGNWVHPAGPRGYWAARPCRVRAVAAR